jgi:hypothetical protein
VNAIVPEALVHDGLSGLSVEVARESVGRLLRVLLDAGDRKIKRAQTVKKLLKKKLLKRAKMCVKKYKV